VLSLGSVVLVSILIYVETCRQHCFLFAVGGTWAWSAPECILGLKWTSAADMYSFGVVLWELATGEIPIRGDMREVNVPEECPPEVAEIMHACWRFDVSLRPTASEILEVIRKPIC
jgi:serine/threonine protein kinase